MEYGIISVIPVVVMVVGSLITKRMIEMSIISSVLAGVLLYKTEFLTGYIDQCYETFAGDTFSAIFLILMGFGAIIELANSTGAMRGFAKALGKYANSRRKSLIVTYILQWILFADDYLMTLGSCYSMRTITDRHRVPREHLSLMGTISANNITSFVPMSSFAVFAIATANEYGYDLALYVKTMPFMIGCGVAMIILLLLSIGLFPKIGPLKSAYKRVDEGGSPLWTSSEHANATDSKPEGIGDDDNYLKPIYFFLPLIVLIIVAATIGIEMSMAVALLCQFIMYVGKKHMNASEFFEHMFEGFKSMTMIAFVIFMVCTMADMSTAMGIDTFLIDAVVGNVPSWILPAMFCIAVFIVCLTTDGWATIALAVPIMLPMATAAGIPMTLAYGAIISGYGLGVPSCLFSDSMFMASACTGIPNDRELKVNIPYIAVMLVITVALLLVVGNVVC